MKIDAHHHFWKYDEEEYPWIEEGMDVLKRDFFPSDLEGNLKASRIDGVISVQARTVPAENEFLLDFARQKDFIKGVVGYVDLTGPTAKEDLEAFSRDAKAVGVREVLQGMSDDAYCLRDDFNEGIQLLHELGLVYDILIFHRHLPYAIEFVDRHPDQTFVLDHVAKPDIRSSDPDPEWVKKMKALGERDHVYCKISGMVTEVAQNIEWSPKLLEPYFEVALEAFGAGRLMFGSDWPVCLLRSDYESWVDTVTTWTDRLTRDEQDALWGGNARKAYQLR